MVAFGLSLLSHIRQIYAVLRQIYALLSLIVRGLALNTQPGFEPELLDGLKPTTITIYRRSVRRFVQWLAEQRLDPLFAWELDRLIVQYVRAKALSRSDFEHGGLQQALPLVVAVCCRTAHTQGWRWEMSTAAPPPTKAH